MTAKYLFAYPLGVICALVAVSCLDLPPAGVTAVISAWFRTPWLFLMLTSALDYNGNPRQVAPGWLIVGLLGLLTNVWLALALWAWYTG